MFDGWHGSRRRHAIAWQPVEPGLQDAFDLPHPPDPDEQGPGAGGLEALGGVAFAESEDAEAGAIALLGVPPGVQDVADELPGGRADALRPVDEPGGAPLGVGPVGGGHVGVDRGVGADLVASAVQRDPAALVEDLDRLR